MENKVSFAWDIHWKCNYNCPYCWWYDRWENLAKNNVYPGLEKLSLVWKRIYDLYGECDLDILGGEPSIYPQFSELMLEILNYHRVAVTTNLSGNMDALINDKSEKVKTKFRIGATFHPLFAKFDEFFNKIKLIREKGVKVGAIYLAYPPQVKDIPKYEKIFLDIDLGFSVLPFWGAYNGKQYPDSYTDDEKKIIGISISSRNNEKFQTEPLVTKGRWCNAGHIHGVIHPDGKVLPCGGIGWEDKEIVIGNIFDPKFKLNDKAMQCPSQNCPCNEWASFLLDKENIRK